MRLKQIQISGLDEKALKKLSDRRLLSLTVNEMRTIQSHFHKAGRKPTDMELETIAQTWSEHCKHKTLTGIIEYKGPGGKERIDNLLGKTVFAVTKELTSKTNGNKTKTECLSVFKDNAGVVGFDSEYGICFKVETHNHPSALEPYGGAATGIGGVIRDILGVGKAARPIMNTDVFCFGELNTSIEDMPREILYPRRIFKGVVSGVRDYGNRMGIPTANGAILFNKRYTGNPLVFCGTVGIIPRKYIAKKVHAGDLIVVCGGATGRDGIHGATFSSQELHGQLKSSVVQIGNPIMEKRTMDFVLQARDKGLFDAITDCGAGGFSSAIGELGRECGARVELKDAPLKYAGLSPWEIWLSESQERMVMAVPPGKMKRLKDIAEIEDVPVATLGRFTNSGQLIVTWKNKVVCNLSMHFLHDGVPRPVKHAVWHRKATSGPSSIHNVVKTATISHTAAKTSFVRSYYTGSRSEKIKDIILSLLASPDISSKEVVIRQYDHEVQGTSILKPLVGVENDGPGDAAVIRPRPDSYRGVAVASGICPYYTSHDPYWMAVLSVDEALRNLTCVGADIARAALLDNFCWGNPDNPKLLGEIVRTAKGCHDAALAYRVPFISGKDSLYNEYRLKSGRNISIPGTLLVSAIAPLTDIRQTTSMFFKQDRNLIYLAGETNPNELAGSKYEELMHPVSTRMHEYKDRDITVPTVNTHSSRKIMYAIHRAIKDGLILSCHDCSEGGIAVALAEMCIGGRTGADIVLKPSTPNEWLFSESGGRFIIEVKPSAQRKFEKHFNKLPLMLLGKVKKDKKLKIRSDSHTETIKVEQLCKAWKEAIKW